MKTYVVTDTNAEGVAVRHEVLGKRFARKKAKQLRLAKALHVGAVISLPVPDEGITETWTNIGGSTVWKMKILETPKRRVRAEGAVKADLGELYRLTRKAARVATALSAITGVECGNLDFSHADRPWKRNAAGTTPRLRFLTDGEVTFTCCPDRFVEHGAWVLAVRGGAVTHTFALRIQDELPSPAPEPLAKVDPQHTTDVSQEEG